jgi:periplasmic divalent cation tolerance protein
MTDKTVVLSTCGSAAEAGSIAHLLVEKRLAACVNILPGVHSVYRWKGVVEDADEWLLVIKTRRVLVEQLTTALREAHSYELPEVLAIPVVEGLERYLSWIDEETAGAPPPPHG